MTEELKPQGHKVFLETIQKILSECTFVINQPEDQTATHVLVYDKTGYFLANGFSACVDPRNYNAEIGKDVALRHAMGNAESALWEREGYALKKDMEAGRYIPTLAERDLPPFALRLVIEHNELAGKLANLQAFLNSPAVNKLEKEEQQLLITKASLMTQYLEILTKRYKLIQGL